MRGLKRTNGESLIETLVALLIIALSFVMLPGAIVSAARVNDKVEKQTTLPDGFDDEAGSEVTLTVTAEGGAPAAKDITLTYHYDTKEDSGGGLYYYEYGKGTGN